MPECCEGKDEDRGQDNVLAASKWDKDIPRGFNLEGCSKCQVTGDVLLNNPKIVTSIP